MFIVSEVTTVGYRRGDLICHERAISLMSRLTPIYTIYGLLYTTFGLGGRHTRPGRPAQSLSRPVGSTAWSSARSVSKIGCLGDCRALAQWGNKAVRILLAAGTFCIRPP
jgi:hypothetical protein